MAGQINWIHTTPLSRIADGMIKARPAGEVSREALGLLAEMEGLLGDPVLNYAVSDA
ncbi:hypothetical protein [Streptomyces sp. NPDC059893]|uniref:hypothetical protein n=1 Tax=Streptomyces sp. NPDC059893 TaxID=3346990 RepID=UPI003654F401